MDNSWEKKWDGRWDQFKGKVKQTWGQMTDDDCDVAEGKYDEMVGRIKTRTGEAEARRARWGNVALWIGAAALVAIAFRMFH